MKLTKLRRMRIVRRKKPLKVLKRWEKAVFTIVLCSLIFQLTLATMQRARYTYEPGSPDNFCCVHMSRECEYIFEAIGITVRQARGEQYNNNITNYSINVGGLWYNGTKREVEVAHQWILLDFGFITIPFEPTAMIPMNPEWQGFQIVEESGGYIIDGDRYRRVAWEKVDD